MCGIAGQVGADRRELQNPEQVYAAMQASMARRGPDQNGLFVRGDAALIHARLSVVDLETGRQPMVLEQGGETYVLVYNGELYNTPELRVELLRLGHRFAGHSDTEVLLHALAEWGESCLERLNGIYAFALWQEKARRLLIARDRIGVKPFFYALCGQSFLFASELKTLLCHPLVRPQINAGGLAEVLLLGPGRTPGCGVFRGVRELLPGQCGVYEVARSRLSLHPYWQLRDCPHEEDFAHTAARVRDLVMDAAERQLVADVPVCTFLSGGLDSSLLSAIADRYFCARGQTLHTVSVGYRDNKKYFQAGKFQPSPDAPYIRLMNGALQAEHTWVTLDTPQLAQALYAAVDARDLPGMADIDSSLLLFCAEVKKVGTVAVSGECADEIFGGYPWYRDKTVRERYGFPWAQSTDYRAGFLKPGVLQGIDPAQYIDDRYRQTLAETDILPGTGPLETRMRQMTMLNLKWFMQTLLDRKDRMSMYSGLEVRVPFCDHRIAEYLYSTPWEYKDYAGHEKGLLRTAMQGVLPQEVLWRKKSPYPKTWNPAYLAAVSDALRTVLADPAAPLLQFIRRDALEHLLAASEAQPWYGQLMTTPQTIAYFLQFNYWLQKYRVEYV